MNEPLGYHKPNLQDRSLARKKSALATIRFGAVLFCVCLPLIFSPVVLGRGLPSTCIAGFAVMGDFLAISCLLQGAWDWWRSK